ncbi:MAG: GrpB family protein [Phycisphaerae bacterium]
MADQRVRLADLDGARRVAECAFAALHAELSILLPHADIQHVGSTSVPGALTKGDLDIAVRVSAGRFERGEAVLARRFARNEGNERTTEFASFKDDDADPPLGVQLVVAGSEADTFVRFRDALRADAALVAEYNALKQSFEGRAMDAYRVAKWAFIDRVLALRIAAQADEPKSA